MPRARQGAGRHDAPLLYGACYCTQHPHAAVGECIQQLRGQSLTDADFRRVNGFTLALVGLRLDASATVVDLDDAAQLVRRALRPSRIATRQRAVTQQTAREIFEEGATGLLWWSILNADWSNVTLFHPRVVSQWSVTTPPRPLSIAMPEVQEAAAELGVQI